MFKHKYNRYKNHYTVKDHCHCTAKYRDAARSKYNLKYSIPKEIPVVFQNGLSFDYCFIMKKFAKEFE